MCRVSLHHPIVQPFHPTLMLCRLKARGMMSLSAGLYPLCPCCVLVCVRWIQILYPGGWGGGGFSGALCGCHCCRSGCGCRVVQSACTGTPSAVPAVSGSGINIAPCPGDRHLTPRRPSSISTRVGNSKTR